MPDTRETPGYWKGNVRLARSGRFDASSSALWELCNPAPVHMQDLSDHHVKRMRLSRRRGWPGFIEVSATGTSYPSSRDGSLSTLLSSVDIKQKPFELALVSVTPD
ncbi:unnamed protein product [Boreogadus saida]